MGWRSFFICIVVSIMVLSFGYVAVAEILLHRLNEADVGRTSAVHRQLHDNALYGSAITGDVSFLKYGVAAEKKPDIIALGTSRTMQFRDAFFRDSIFFTFGGIGDSVDAMKDVFDRTSLDNAPKIVILGVDWDWFNPKYPHAVPENALDSDNLLNQRMYVYKSLFRAVSQNPKIRTQLLHPEFNTADTIGKRPTIGLADGANDDGFRSDGSYQYGEYILHPKSLEERLADTYDRIEKGDRRFDAADEIDKSELVKLEALIHHMRQRGCHVIVFLPPFPDQIYQSLLASAGHSAFMLQFEDAIRNLCEKQNVSFFDFSNMAWLGATDEEAIDGFHASERTYGRIVLRFQEDEKISPYINAEYIEECLYKSEHIFQIVPERQ
ncbi:hypothetical protein TAMA11512_03030 [Selenomonas sp. TAMA-11512]|uniref:SGNH/GDSL hydrolase family protein n=1 Tax=Selenomonas sp. TAMA-11512 TaxID=3095337 RepID=UPI0030894393|nr:hypothetical protein TAMA11512_03030 [Selenomonas sp. TAMA-11512]